jgi:uncharacterized membrane protein YhaH (DUF805 family)
MVGPRLNLVGQTWAQWTSVVLAVVSGRGNFSFLAPCSFWPILIVVGVLITWALVTVRRRRDIRLTGPATMP